MPVSFHCPATFFHCPATCIHDLTTYFHPHSRARHNICRVTPSRHQTLQVMSLTKVAFLSVLCSTSCLTTSLTSHSKSLLLHHIINCHSSIIIHPPQSSLVSEGPSSIILDYHSLSSTMYHHPQSRYVFPNPHIILPAMSRVPNQPHYLQPWLVFSDHPVILNRDSSISPSVGSYSLLICHITNMHLLQAAAILADIETHIKNYWDKTGVLGPVLGPQVEQVPHPPH